LTLADNQVFAFSDINQARSYLGGYKASDATSCLQSVYNQPFGPSGVRVQGTPMVSSIVDLERVGDESVGYQVIVNLTGGSSTFALFWDLIYVRVGRATVHFVFNNVGQRLAQEPGIVRAVTSRLDRVAQ
jgi:hypothetical protein